MKHRQFLLLLLIPLLLALLLPGQVAARIYLDITSPELRKIAMAIPPLVDRAKDDQPTDSGRQMADILSRAMELHGFSETIDPKLYGERQDANWQRHGAEFVIQGSYREIGGNFQLELRLLDINAGRMIHGRRYQAPRELVRRQLLRYIDESVEVLTGKKGISNSKIAFVSDATGHKEIHLADILGDNVRQVTRHQYLAVSPRFTRDGEHLTYTSHHRGNANLYQTNIRELKTTRAISRWVGLNMTPTWAPDDNRMVLTLSRDGNPDLYLTERTGKIIRRLTHGEGVNVSPSFSPDGRRLAFVSDRSGTPQIYLMDMRTMAIQRLTFQGHDNTTPSWSPDGKWIAYTSRIDGVLHIAVISPEGGPPRQVTRTWGHHESPSWSPDSRQLVFARLRHDREELCAIFLDGSGLRVLFGDQSGNHSMPQWSPRLAW
ncbi:PD40 domain-containing protein [Desulfurivibrio alkaliphilus]|uniref:WD40 domain protein beta Propeller n=1 Tax=Desulfurivibrio alkaliphilus (strain DSM 19089 / UNIQEM U267 / AHT2) TaxID=589865 RepID=D6Z218_DESAT|nr:PD40 domain-containing protein [Desulfurivibrio alkaliphilus]ADH85593.1 WD40 domain protein beta Propeller [Desulfurivibrio alkaliphilus AHT 2]